MGFQPVENFKGFMTHRPPLVMFMITLGVFAVILVSVAYYVKLNDLQNPDVKDWNNFLESFSTLEFCVTGNLTESSATEETPTTTPLSKKSKRDKLHKKGHKLTTTPVEVYDETQRNHSVSLLLTVEPTMEFVRQSHNITKLSAIVYGHHLGLRGSRAQEAINVTIDLPVQFNKTHCKNNHCAPMQIVTCVFFHGTTALFPSTRMPDTCYGMNETGVEYHAEMDTLPQTSMFKSQVCRNKVKVKADYSFNPSLTMWLSVKDKSVINLHLMHTSYFLFVMVVTLLCYAIIRGKPKQIIKVVHVQPDKASNGRLI
ncbi:unnamed protein product [Owenia fusiformis]|uniref:Uncharacterized protein n=1 Tax=Owenia fusiformis TaxID=6347 RepID=A0A8J1UVZ3_OWEFU|nr:unnamed protein product [Owenia fusiformis]